MIISKIFMFSLMGVIIFIMSFYILNMNQSSEMMFLVIESILQLTIEKLTDLKLYCCHDLNKTTQLNFSKENSKVFQIDENDNFKEYQYKCPNHRYTTRIIQRKPMMIYIEQFLTQDETQHLVELAEPFFKPSKVYNHNGELVVDDFRTSSSWNIKRHQTPVVDCIERRFAQFQGDIDLERMEQLQVVKYTQDQQVQPHYDWFSQSNVLKNGGQRVTTFVTYLQSNYSEGGETEFLSVKFNQTLHERFCDIIICDEKSSKSGLRFRPLAGNSIFWFNIDEQGHVDYLTYHAGRPPTQHGYKIGLNTWTRESKLSISSET